MLIVKDEVKKRRRRRLVYKNSYEWKKTKGSVRGNQRINSFPIFLLHLRSLTTCSDSGPGVLSMNVCDQAFYKDHCSDRSERERE